MHPNEPTAGIAIIGMSCRMPGAKDPAAFWANLRDGVEAVQFLTADDLVAAGLDPRLLQHPGYVNAAIRLEDVDLFDATFFGFSPREAELLDPQQRLFLECAWEALERAGCEPQRYRGLIGVYAGVNASHYAFNLYAAADLVRTMGMFQISLATDKDHISTRTAYKLNLRGPAVTVQTTCSTSLVAICQACQSLLNYQCDLALAGASSILLNQNGYIYQEDGIPSPDGHCRAFDAMAKGTVGGSGVGVVALKRLDDALADGDPIHAVIRGFAVNNDGSHKVGYTAPSIDGQAEVISMALAMGAVDPETVGYVEAHGTGTPLGDPIEVAALTKAYRDAGARRNQYCGIGSVKTNLGHLDPAAGVAGLMKAVLALEHRALPPSLHFKQPNPNIDFANSPFYVNATLADWPATGAPRRAAVSSFGIGGTNAHVVLEEAPSRAPGSPSRPWQLLPVSARSSAAVDKAARNLADWLRHDTGTPVGDVAWTLQTGRKAFAWRRVALCGPDQREQTIATLETQGSAVAAGRGGTPEVAFLFSGQGSQYVHMGAELYRSEHVFREAFDTCADLLRPHLDDDLRRVVYPDAGDGPDAQARLTRTAWAQPALFAVEYALARQWQHWGVVPQALAGHSIGELVAACLAEVFTLEHALALVAARGRLMQSMPPGAMLSVLLPEADLAPQLPPDVSIAAINAPDVTVISGPVAAIEALRQTLEARGTGCRPLQTSHAFHSQMMEPILEPFAEQVRQARPRAPRVPFVSNVTGDWITPEQATDPLYWARHVRGTVRFLDNVRALLAAPGRLLLEVGPGKVLATLAAQAAGRPGERTVLRSLPHPKEPQTDQQCMLDALGRLWLQGQNVAWETLHEGERRMRVPLPTYPFERQRFWIDAPQPGDAAQPQTATGRRDVGQWAYVPVWDAGPVADAALPDALAAEPCTWLILGNAGHLGDAVAALLVHHDHRVVRAHAAQEFAALEHGNFTLDPARREDYASLVAALEQAGTVPRRVVHLFAHGAELSDPADATQARQHGYYSVLYLAQALAPLRLDAPLHASFVADRLHACDDDADPLPEKAATLGLLRVIPQEFPNLRWRSIDVDGAAAREQADAAIAARRLVAELAATPFEPAVALRGDTRRVERWRPMRLSAAEGTPPRLRARGVYLVTGGLGQIGLAIADYLARTVQARLVLVGRTALPPRWQWEEHARRHPADPLSARIAKLLELERAGAQVLPLSADTADAAQMRSALDAATQTFGAIHGVIHAAGHTAAATRPLAEIDAAYAEAHFRPKADGLRALDALLADRPLDFVVLMSSLSALLGGLGFGAYAAANAYLDAYAAARNRRGFVPWISVDWDGWDFTGGPAADYLLPAEGVEAIRRLLHRRVERAAVSVTPLPDRLRKWVYLESPLHAAPRGATAATAPADAAAVEHHTRPSLSSAYLAPRNDIEAAIVAVWEDLLGVRPIGVDDNYFELGGHSLLAIQVASRLRDQFQVKLAVQTLFEAPTVGELARRIEQERGAESAGEEAQLRELLSQIEQLSDEEVQALLGEDKG